MEVFIRNVPQQSNDKALRNFLRPTFRNLSIQNVKYDNHFGKPFASLTFLNASDAEKFLNHHGQVRGTPNKKPVPINQILYVQLRFLGQPIYCEKSNRDANPFTLRGLQREEKERQLQDHERDGKPKQPEIFPVEFRTFSVSCGTWAYHFDDLVFAPQVTWDVGGTAKFGKRSMILTLDSGFRIDFRYSGVDGIATQDLPCPSFIFSMTEPPRLFEKIPEDPVASLLAHLGLANRARPSVQRKGPERHRLPCLSADHEPIVGNCLAYRITLGKGYSISPKALHEISELIEKLKKAHEMPPMVHGVTSIYSDGERYSEAFQLLRESLSSLAIGLPFEVAFQVHKLAQNNYLPPMTVLELLPDIREMYELSKLTVTVAAVRKLFNQIPYPGPDVEAKVFELERLRELLVANEASVIKEGLSVVFTPQSNVAVIHRIKITPTGMYLYGPEPETNNRILRKYSTHHDCFLRVQFCDEDGQPLFFNSRVSSYRIFQGRFKHILQDGIEVGGRTFNFLGFSHSSLRMQSCWFVTPFFHNGELITDRMIIMGLGNFTPIRSPAKCAARIGQAFSDTPTAVPFPSHKVEILEDVECNGRVFSDGVGTMSRAVMEKIYDNYPKALRSMPSCFQIRYRGAKGMISLDTRLEGDALLLRDSMIKYEGSTSNDIEICEASYRPLPAYLNRQLIKIMEDMGVDENWFLKLQVQEVERLRTITDSPINASSFLKRQSIGEPVHLPWLINELTMLNLDFREDGFLRDVLEVALLVELRMLKHKTRIPVPKGWHLHGIMDETRLLEEGQVFCVVTVEGMRQFVTGKNLLITRAPALHPGDVQLVEGIEPPLDSPLRELSNCICFSQKGKRDLPSQLSGGDLDGDRYYIFWDEDAIPKTTYPPADYPRQNPIDIGRNVEVSDMTDFFILFMETDQLGRIAVGHQVLSDQRDDGTLDEDCIKLAGLHSTAVDFSKTGIPADMSRLPKYNRWRPDFLAPGPHVHIEKGKGIFLTRSPSVDPDDVDDEDDDFTSYRYYESDKILGKLYRAIDEKEIFENIQQRALVEGITSSSTVIDAVWDYVQSKCLLIQWDHKLEWARDIRELYEDTLRNIMKDYSTHPHRPLSELEAFVGNILGRTGAPSKHQRELSTSMKDKFAEDSSFIVNCILKDGTELSEESLERSMACLSVSLEDRPAHKGQEQLLSFKYVAAAVCLREAERFLVRTVKTNFGVEDRGELGE